MTLTDFYRQAEWSISNNPLDRLPNNLKNVLTALPRDTEKMLFDVHAQCFTMKKRPSGLWTDGISLRWSLKKWLPGNARAHYSPADQRYLAAYFASRYGTPEGILAHQFELFNHAFEQKLFKARPHIFIALLMGGTNHDESGKSARLFYDQWRALSEVRNKRLNNRAILPFLSVDPRNPDLYTDFLSAFSDISRRINTSGQDFLDKALPFFGVCIQPGLGFMPSDPVLMPVYQVCAAKKIPVSVLGESVTARFTENIKGKHLVRKGTAWETGEYALVHGRDARSSTAKAAAVFFNAPENWAPVAETFPGLKINLSDSWFPPPDRKPVQYDHQGGILNMLARYPNVYTDVAGACNRNLANLSKLLYGPAFTEARRDVFRTRFLFSSNYYLNNAEKDFVSMTVAFFQHFKHDKAMLNQLCIHNPMRFLFE